MNPAPPATLLARVAGAHLRDPARVDAETRGAVAEALSAPIREVLRLADAMAGEVPAAGSAALVEGVRRIRVSGRLLLPLVGEVLDPARVPPGRYAGEWEAVAARLRAYLRTPLAAVGCHAGLLGDDPAAASHPRLPEALREARAAVDLAVALLDDVAATLDLLSGAAPASEPSAEARAAVEGARSASPSPARPTAAEVLVVDDSQVNRDLLHRMLSRLGHGVALAGGGLQALAMLRSRPYDLVLLDIIMPEVDGFAVLQQMKADRHLRGVPVIMISALDEVVSAGRALEMGADAYLTKPFDPVVLRERVGEALGRRREGGEARSA